MDITIKTESTPIADVSESIDPMITSYFSLNPNDIEDGDKTKLKDIEKYLSKYEDPMEKMQQLRDIRSRVGTPQLGQSQIDMIYKYMKLTLAMNDIKEQMQEIER